jgi:glucokinase
MVKQDITFHEGQGPRLLADIGGTNARFALETGPQVFKQARVLPCDAYASLELAIRDYLVQLAAQGVQVERIRHAAIAIANPVDGDEVKMTNHHWEFSIAALRTALGWETLEVVNDFTALAMALPYLDASQKRQVGGGQAQAGKPIGLIGAGTGLGVSGIIPAGGKWVPLASEGGHVTFSPFNEEEMTILHRVWREHGHVSAERLLSGMGLELIYRMLASESGESEMLSAAEISHRALAQDSSLCSSTVAHFCAMLGTVAANLALTLGASGGMYIGGGIVPRLGPLFSEASFRTRFENKGRFSTYLAQIPTYVITAEYPAFLGVSAILAEKLAAA